MCQLVFVSFEVGTSTSTLCFPNYPGLPTTQQTGEEDLHLKACSKTVIISLCNSHVSWRMLQRVGDHTLLQTWWPQTTLLIRYTESSSDRLAVIWIRNIALVRMILPLLSAY